MLHLNNGPSESFRKHIQQTIHKCNTITDKNQQKYLIQIKLMTTKLNALIKTHKEGKTIRPVINNIRTPAYKLPKYLNKKLTNYYNYHILGPPKFKETAQDLNETR